MFPRRKWLSRDVTHGNTRLALRCTCPFTDECHQNVMKWPLMTIMRWVTQCAFYFMLSIQFLLCFMKRYRLGMGQCRHIFPYTPMSCLWQLQYSYRQPGLWPGQVCHPRGRVWGLVDLWGWGRGNSEMKLMDPYSGHLSMTPFFSIQIYHISILVEIDCMICHP